MVMMILGSVLIGLVIALVVASVWNKKIGAAKWLVGCLASLSASSWFRKPWSCGGLVFLYNLLLFGLTFTVFWWGNAGSEGRMFIPVPFLVIPAVLLSLLAWIWVGGNWQGRPLRERIKVGAVGSSFYWGLVGWAVYMMLTMEPAFPGDDLFMAMIGLMMLVVIAGTAATLCLSIIAWPRKYQR